MRVYVYNLHTRMHIMKSTYCLPRRFPKDIYLWNQVFMNACAVCAYRDRESVQLVHGMAPTFFHICCSMLVHSICFILLYFIQFIFENSLQINCTNKHFYFSENIKINCVEFLLKSNWNRMNWQRRDGVTQKRRNARSSEWKKANATIGVGVNGKEQKYVIS